MVYFVNFKGQGDDEPEQWLRSAYSVMEPGRQVVVGDNLGKGSSGVVLACRYRNKAVAVKIFVNYELEDDEVKPSQSDVRVILGNQGKRKRANAEEKSTAWYEHAQSFLLEIGYARVAAKANVGPQVYAAAILMRGNPVCQLAMCLVMEQLNPVLNLDHKEVLSLLKRVSQCRLFCLDLKREHVMQTNLCELRMVDFGSEWCMRKLPAAVISGVPLRPVRLPALKSAMQTVMTMQLALHTLFWKQSGNDGVVPFLFDELWHLWHDNRQCWNLAKCIFDSKKAKPICDTYFQRSGADLFDTVAQVFSTCTPTVDGRLISEAGSVWRIRNLLAVVSGRTPSPVMNMTHLRRSSTTLASATTSVPTTLASPCLSAVSL